MIQNTLLDELHDVPRLDGPEMDEALQRLNAGDITEREFVGAALGVLARRLDEEEAERAGSDGPPGGG